MITGPPGPAPLYLQREYDFPNYNAPGANPLRVPLIPALNFRDERYLHDYTPVPPTLPSNLFGQNAPQGMTALLKLAGLM